MRKSKFMNPQEISTLSVLTNCETLINTLEDHFGRAFLKASTPSEMAEITSHLESLITNVYFRSSTWINPGNMYARLNQVKIVFKDIKSKTTIIADFDFKLRAKNIKILCEINGIEQVTTMVLRYMEGKLPLFIELVLTSYIDYFENWKDYYNDLPF